MKKGAVILKVDPEKAYDRLEWTFIKSTLVDAGLPCKLVVTIMRLVSGGILQATLEWRTHIRDQAMQGLATR